MEKNDDNNARSATADTVGKILRYAAYPTSMVVGIPIADVGLRTNLYKNFARRGAFGGKIISVPRGVQEEETALAQKIWYETLKAKETIHPISQQYVQRYEIAHNLRPASEALIKVMEETAIVGKNAVEKLNNLVNKGYRTEVRHFFEDLDIKNWRDYWPIITRNQRIEIAALALTATAVTLGAILTISDHRGLIASLFPDKDRDKTPAR